MFEKVLFQLLTPQVKGGYLTTLSDTNVWSFSDFLDQNALKSSTKSDFLLSQLYAPTDVTSASTNESPMYLTNVNFQKINLLSSSKELFNLNQTLGVQNSLINTMRWSYRYNILHRRSMYNSHKITVAKKLLGSGFFGLNTADNNVWFSDHYARNLDHGKKNRHLNSINVLRHN